MHGLDGQNCLCEVLHIGFMTVIISSCRHICYVGLIVETRVDRIPRPRIRITLWRWPVGNAQERIARNWRLLRGFTLYCEWSNSLGWRLRLQPLHCWHSHHVRLANVALTETSTVYSPIVVILSARNCCCGIEGAAIQRMVRWTCRFQKVLVKCMASVFANVPFFKPIVPVVSKFKYELLSNRVFVFVYFSASV